MKPPNDRDVAVGDRLDELCARWSLDRHQREQLATLLEVLARDRHAPSAITDRPRAVDVHLADSLAALELIGMGEAVEFADIGAGAGFPGLVLAVALPTASVALVESAARKAEFIERARRAAQIPNARAVATRIELWSEGHEAHDVVTARALGPRGMVCEYAAPLLRVGGRLIVWRGRRDRAEEANAARAAAELGLEARETVRSAPYAGAVEHHLHVYAKTERTPAQFPRRPGVAVRRPLGGSSSG